MAKMSEEQKAAAEEAKNLKTATDASARAMRDVNDLTRNLGTLLKERIKDAGTYNALVKNTSEILQNRIKDTYRLGTETQKLAQTEKDLARTNEKLAKSRDAQGRFQKGFNSSIVKGLQVNKAGLQAEKKRLEILSYVEKTAKKIKEALTLTALITASTKAAQEFARTIDGIGGTFGSLANFGQENVRNLLGSQIQAVKLGGTIADVNSIAFDLSTNFGVSVEEATKLAGSVFDSSKALGLSASETSNLFGLLKQTAGLSFDQAESLSEGAAQLARANGVAPSAVLRDIAGSAETLALFTADTVDNLFEAAVQARKFGLTISDISGAARKTLDFQSSIRAETQASVLLGRTLNLQKAREFALNNKFLEFNQEIVRQLGNQRDFNSLNRLEQESLAEALGFSVAQIAKLTSGTQKLTLAGALAAGNFDDLAGQQALTNITQLTNSFVVLTKTLANSFGPALNVVAKLLNFVLSPFVKLAEFTQKNQLAADMLTGSIGLLAASYGVLKVKTIAGILAQTAMKSALLKTAASAIFGKAAMGSVGGIIGTIAAIAAAGAAIGGVVNYVKSMDDGVVGPGGINFMSGPAGSFVLNPRDSVMATTNPIRANDFQTFPPGQAPGSGGGRFTATAVARGSDIHFIVNNRPLTGGDAGYSSFFKSS